MKSIQMYYYNKLRQTNPSLAKSKQGRSMIMDEAVFMATNSNVIVWNVVWDDSFKTYIYQPFNDN